MSITADSARYLRVASITMAAYDYLITLPAEYRFYRHQETLKRPSLACILFILNRYLSIVTIVVSNLGTFAKFSPTACEHFYLVPPAFKGIQAFVSQVVLGVRTYAISKRSPWVGRLLAVIFVIICALEMFVSLYGRVAVRTAGNCSSGNSPSHEVAWIHYVFAMFYDVLTLGISSYYLLGQGTRSWGLSRLFKILFIDGIGFFIILTAVNVFNLIVYKQAPAALQSAGVSLGYAVTMIMTQRILISLQNLATGSSGGYIPSRSKPMAGDAHQLTWVETTNREFAPELSKQPVSSAQDVEMAVQVHVTRAVDVDGNSAASKADSLYANDSKTTTL